jgi:hypothetical protein
MYREKVTLTPFEYDQIVSHIESDRRRIRELEEEITRLDDYIEGFEE